jgi:hypothetical protein
MALYFCRVCHLPTAHKSFTKYYVILGWQMKMEYLVIAPSSYTKQPLLIDVRSGHIIYKNNIKSIKLSLIINDIQPKHIDIMI